MAADCPIKSLLKREKETVDEYIPSNNTNQLAKNALHGKLNEILSAITAARHANARIELSCKELGDVWHIVVKLWVGPYNSPWMASGH